MLPSALFVPPYFPPQVMLKAKETEKEIFCDDVFLLIVFVPLATRLVPDIPPIVVFPVHFSPATLTVHDFCALDDNEFPWNTTSNVHDNLALVSV